MKKSKFEITDKEPMTIWLRSYEQRFYGREKTTQKTTQKILNQIKENFMEEVNKILV